MMKTILEGSKAVAETVRMCKPAVIAAYPITPQTHIVEELAKLVADGKLKSKYLEVESEFTAISACLGATAAGYRSFTATSSQGLALMHEVLFTAAGMRLPLVMVVANRALSAPINIWNDQQDSIAERDSGWLQLYCESVQEAVDTVLQAYKIAESVLLPAMVCMDGYYLTHVVETVDIMSQQDVEKFLPAYKPKHAYLDPQRPITQGPIAYPAHYMIIRKQLADAMIDSIEIVKKAHDDFARMFKRRYGNGIVEEYKNDKKVAVVAMGSICGTIKEVVDKNKFGLMRVRCFRPFPKKYVASALKDKELVIVIDRNISLGNSGALSMEVRDCLYGQKGPRVVNYIVGLGGVDTSSNDIEKIVMDAKKRKDGEVVWWMKGE
jgi:pyruvate ferredoxin oxidoreductase alpha subunit